MVQLQLLDLMISRQCGAVPMDAATRADLIDLVARVIAAVLREEGRAPESIFDFVQGITAVARGKEHQDSRLEMEQRAKRLLDRAA